VSDTSIAPDLVIYAEVGQKSATAFLNGDRATFRFHQEWMVGALRAASDARRSAMSQAYTQGFEQACPLPTPSDQTSSNPVTPYAAPRHAQVLRLLESLQRCVLSPYPQTPVSDAVCLQGLGIDTVSASLLNLWGMRRDLNLMVVPPTKDTPTMYRWPAGLMREVAKAHSLKYGVRDLPARLNAWANGQNTPLLTLPDA
jgi:hypothetical protein